MYFASRVYDTIGKRRHLAGKCCRSKIGEDDIKILLIDFINWVTGIDKKKRLQI